MSGTSSCTAGIPQGGVTGYKDVARSEQALMSAISQQPVSIAVEADRAVFQSYRSGVMSELAARIWITVSWRWDMDLKTARIIGWSKILGAPFGVNRDMVNCFVGRVRKESAAF